MLQRNSDIRLFHLLLSGRRPCSLAIVLNEKENEVVRRRKAFALNLPPCPSITQQVLPQAANDQPSAESL